MSWPSRNRFSADPVRRHRKPVSSTDPSPLFPSLSPTRDCHRRPIARCLPQGYCSLKSEDLPESITTIALVLRYLSGASPAFLAAAGIQTYFCPLSRLRRPGHGHAATAMAEVRLAHTWGFTVYISVSTHGRALDSRCGEKDGGRGTPFPEAADKAFWTRGHGFEMGLSWLAR